MQRIVVWFSGLACLVCAAQSAPPTRVVSLAPNLTAMITELGSAESLVAVTPFCAAPQNVRRVPGGMLPEAEAVLALEADLVLATSITPASTLRQLRDLGIRTEVFETGSLEQIRQAMEKLAGIFEVAPPPPTTGGVPVAKSKRAALLFGAETGYSAGCGTHAHEIIESAGLRNIAAEVSGPWPQLSEEFLLAADPEIIIVADYGDAKKAELLEFLRAHPLRKHLAAVQDGRVIVFPAQAFSIPGPAALEAGNKLRAEVEKL
jgi:iron complex transport system substrate-binding protein